MTAAPPVDRPRFPGRVGRGLVAGLLGALAMTFVVVLARWVAGVPLIVDLVSDRVIPQLSVRTFGRLLGRVGGPVRGKELAYLASFAAQLAAGVVGGGVFAALARRSNPKGWRRAVRVGSVLLAVLWLGFLSLLWPALASNYRGLQPTPARVLNALALLAAFVAYGGVVAFCLRGPSPEEAPASPGRRALLLGGAGAALAVATSGLAGLLYRRATFGSFGYDGLQLRGPRTEPITPNDRFYVVTKNLVDPEVDAGWWRLAIDGAVDKPRTYSLDELAALPSVRQEQTLECISNRVGSGLMSNAVWTGVRVPDLLAGAGISTAATRVIMHAADGYTHTISLEKAMEPTTVVALRMNGRSLPTRHGYPARLLVPGTYGEVHVKWLDTIEVTDQPFEGYYEKQGWKPYFVNTTSRFDTPTSGQRIAASSAPVVLSGVAFAGDRGISLVEVSTDGGATWGVASVEYPGTRLTWSLWSHGWTPPGTGSFDLLVRATDGQGRLQTDVEHGAIPAGATGLHRVRVVVE